MPASTLTPAVGVRAVDLPAELDRPQIVTRSGTNSVQLAEFDRWSAPLRDIIARLIAENLAAQLPADRVAVYPWMPGDSIEQEVTVEITRFDGRRGVTRHGMRRHGAVRAPDAGGQGAPALRARRHGEALTQRGRRAADHGDQVRVADRGPPASARRRDGTGVERRHRRGHRAHGRGRRRPRRHVLGLRRMHDPVVAARPVTHRPPPTRGPIYKVRYRSTATEP